MPTKSHAKAKKELKEQRKTERKEQWSAKWTNFTAHSFHLVVLAIAGVLIFAGVQSLIQADPVIRYTISSVVVLFIVKELY